MCDLRSPLSIVGNRFMAKSSGNGTLPQAVVEYRAATIGLHASKWEMRVDENERTRGIEKFDHAPTHDLNIHFRQLTRELTIQTPMAGLSVMNEQKLERDKIDILVKHLPYELDMLEQALVTWRDAQNDPENTYTKNSAIETFWLHARSLADFFRNAKTGRTATASHFTAGWVEYSMGDVRALVTKVSDQIAHLSFDRAPESYYEKLNFDDAIRSIEHIDRAVQTFQQNLKEDAAQHWRPRAALTTMRRSETLVPSSDSYATASLLGRYSIEFSRPRKV